MAFFYSQLFVKPTYPTTSCAGQAIIVTGANVGLGKEAAHHFVRLGASTVILAVRNTKAGDEAKTSIESNTNCGPNIIQVWPLDLSSHESCRAFAKRASELPRIDVLLENAGVAGVKFNLVGGYEQHNAINVIGTFYLALLMLPKLKESAKKFSINPRLVFVESEVHGHTEFPQWKEPSIFDTLNIDSGPDPNERYCISKLLGVLTVRELASKLEGSGVVINMLNPGLCHSELGRDAGWGFTIFKFFIARSTEVGSRTLVASAVAEPESHGKYMSDAKIDDNALSPFVRSADGKKAGRKVWSELSEILEKIQPGVIRNL